MTKKRAFFFAALMVSIAGIASAQGLDPVLLTKPATDAWPTYSGDYSGRRFSSLTQINQTNIKNLGLAWVNHLTPGPGLESGPEGLGPGVRWFTQASPRFFMLP